jgi:hypothetical protein
MTMRLVGGSAIHSNSQAIGDAGNVVSLIAGVTFAAVVVQHFRQLAEPTTGQASVFDPLWIGQGGFCVTSPDIPYWNSHDMCLYVDTVAAVVLSILYYFFGRGAGKQHDQPSLLYANDVFVKNIPGIFFHGLAHGRIGQSIRDNVPLPAASVSTGESMLTAAYGQVTGGDFIPNESGLRSSPELNFLTSTLLILLFWVFMLRSALPWFSFPAVAACAAVACALQLLTPQALGFTYVQTVLVVAFHFNQLLSVPDNVKRDNVGYAMFPWIVSLPLTMIGWMESTQCSNFVQSTLYGHALYDSYIPSSTALWYVTTMYFYRDSKPKTE